MFFFPFFLLKSLRLTHFRERLGLALLLTLGMLTIVVSTARFLYMTFLVNDISLGMYEIPCASPPPKTASTHHY